MVHEMKAFNLRSLRGRPVYITCLRNTRVGTASTLDSYSRGAWFESRLEDRFLATLLSPSRPILGQDLDRDRAAQFQLTLPSGAV
jgi:hypothetical protein